MDLRRVDRLAETMVSYSLQVNRDEVVLICGEVSSAVLLDRLYQAVLSAGARPVLRLKGDLSLETHLELGGHQTLNPTSVSDGTPIDCSIGIWTLYKSDRKRQPVEQAVASRDLARQSEFLCRAAEGKIRWVVALWPTDDAADMAGMNQ